MGKIARIQLRGISRSPSDRLTTDGGLNESLNVQLDHTELVQMPKPTEVDLSEYAGEESEIGAVVDYFYIHKGTYYENIIALVSHDPDSDPEKQTRLVAFCKGRGQQDLFELNEETDEKVHDVASVGNTLVVTTTDKMHYVLFKDGQYKYLGDNIPIPKINFYMKPDASRSSPFIPISATLISDANTERNTMGFLYDHADFEPTGWGTRDRSYRVIRDSQRVVITNIWNYISQAVKTKAENSKCIFPVFVRYAVRLYDGRLYACSAPVLMGDDLSSYLAIRLFSQYNGDRIDVKDDMGSFTETYAYDVAALVELPEAYRIVADFSFNELFGTDWEDIVSSIDLFVSTPILPMSSADTISLSTPSHGAQDPIVPGVWDAYLVDAELDPISFQEKPEKLLEQHQATYLVRSWDIKDLVGKTTEELTDIDYSGDWLLSQEVMKESYNTVHKVRGDKLSTYNDRIVLEGADLKLYPGHPFFCATDLTSSPGINTFYFVWHIRVDGKERLVISKNPTGGTDFVGMPAGEDYTSALGWLSYPDARAFKVDVYKYTSGSTLYKTYQTKAFSEINVSYIFDGFGFSFVFSGDGSGSYSGEPELPTETDEITLDDQIMMSESSNPFIFPAEGVIDFDGDKIIGTAMATKALSPGQFGQFPLYVFTSTGIWSLTLNSEGAFVAKHPVTRDVAIDGTIVPIDQAIVFTTDKAVMLLTGSDIKNISPDMNGKHYVLPDAVASVLLDPNLTYASQRKESFIAFMRSAKPVYDYAGERLLFFSDTYGGYMYVYRLTTGTWHKTSLVDNSPITNFDWYIIVLKSVPVEYRAAVASILVSHHGYLSERDARTAIDNAPCIINTYTYQSIAETRLEELIQAGADAEIPAKIEASHPYFRALNSYPNAWLSQKSDFYLPETKIKNFSAILNSDGTEGNVMTAGLVVTRTLDFGIPDIYKSITRVKIRGEVDRRNKHSPYKYILLGSNDGVEWAMLHSLRGPSFKYFRVVVLTTLTASERLSYLEIEYEPRFTNKIR